MSELARTRPVTVLTAAATSWRTRKSAVVEVATVIHLAVLVAATPRTTRAVMIVKTPAPRRMTVAPAPVAAMMDAVIKDAALPVPVAPPLGQRNLTSKSG